MSKNIPTFLKWAGGKQQLLDQITPHLPNKIDDYVEPFLGGGAILFFIIKYKKPKKAFAYDLNSDLINVYNQIKGSPLTVIKFLKKFQDEHNFSSDKKKYFYDKREEYNTHSKNKLKRAALFIYLNKTCFNGLYRVNSIGEFNVPFGKYESVIIYEKEKIIEASKLLKKVKLNVLDFRLVNYPKRSFVYFDPPYWSESKNNGFTNYNELNFKQKDQIDLSQLIKNLSKKKIKIMLNNSDTELIKLLYPKTLFFVSDIDSRWVINCKGNKRDLKKELLIKNYQKK